MTTMQKSNIKMPPNNNDAEESVIGSILIDGEAVREVENILAPSDFYFENNRYVYQAALNLRERREGINQVTIGQELDRMVKLKDIGGSAHLAYLVSVVPTSLDIEYYGLIVRRLSVSRQMIALGQSISETGYKDNPDINGTIEEVFGKVQTFRKGNVLIENVINPKGAADVVYDLITEYNNPKNSIKYGFADMDELTSGIYPELIIVGARPSVGKTQLMLDLLENIVLQGKKVLFASVEMSIKSLMERKIARELKIDIRQLRRGITTDAMDKIIHISGIVSEQQVYYLDEGSSSYDVYNETKRLIDAVGIDIVFVDYLQLLKDCWELNGRDNKVVAVGRACKVLKSIVKDFEIPVVCASQLNRASEYRTGDNRFPVLADLRESGDIEQDADIVFLLHRDKETDGIDNINPKILRVQMAKNRQLGWAKSIQLMWHEESRRYVNAYGGS